MRSGAIPRARSGSKRNVPAAEVVDAAVKWLPSTSAPFFLWVHLYDPHAPYEPPADFLQKARGTPYDGEVAYADAQVGRLLEELQRRNLAGSTVVALSGDHGESLGEHGEDTHGMLAYDATLRVPWSSPRRSIETSKVDDAAVSLAALRPRPAAFGRTAGRRRSATPRMFTPRAGIPAAPDGMR